MSALANADLVLVIGGVLFASLAAFSWAADAGARRILRGRGFDDRVNSSLETRYSDSRSFRSLFNGVHEVANQPVFMVLAMLGIAIVSIAVGALYVHSPDVALPFVILVFILGLTLHFGDVIEAVFVVSYAEKSELSRSDRKSVEYFGRVVNRGKYLLLGLALCLLAASWLSFSGLLPQDTAPITLIGVAFAPCLALSYAWRGILKRIQPSITRPAPVVGCTMGSPGFEPGISSEPWPPK